jgi:thiamine pyrophosphate-dependent acetolactate synthase large subunit-like protein
MIASMSELLTCVRYNLAITVIVVKNQVYSIEKKQDGCGRDEAVWV